MTVQTDGTTGVSTGDGSAPRTGADEAGTRIEVCAEDVAALGEALGRVAGDLRWHTVAVADRSWALGPGATAAVLAEVLGDFEHQRLLLGRTLADLAAGACRAGALYVEVEHRVGGMLDGGAP